MQKITPKLVIANWKMNLSFSQTGQWCTDNSDRCARLQAETETTIVLCPSFDALATAAHQCIPKSIAIGAQNCSRFQRGSYTGQVSALSLAQIGCTYCIIGHYECRTLGNETNTDIAQKLEQLLDNRITPILCIGQATQKGAAITHEALRAQLTPLFDVLTRFPSGPLIIAYEPVWAIGTNLVPDLQYLTDIFAWLADQCNHAIAHRPYSLIYGGGVNEQNGAMLRDIPFLDGFLVGGASLDFQKFKKIVSLLKR